MDTVSLSLAASDLFAALGSDAAPLVIDVRRQAIFEADDKMVAGATWRDPFTVNEWEKFLPRHRPVVVYCVHGHEISQNVASALCASGVDARYLEGGFDAWLALCAPTLRKRIAPGPPS